jgi:hypothetical protein
VSITADGTFVNQAAATIKLKGKIVFEPSSSERKTYSRSRGSSAPASNSAKALRQ